MLPEVLASCRLARRVRQIPQTHAGGLRAVILTTQRMTAVLTALSMRLFLLQAGLSPHQRLRFCRGYWSATERARNDGEHDAVIETMKALSESTISTPIVAVTHEGVVDRTR